MGEAEYVSDDTNKQVDSPTSADYWYRQWREVDRHHTEVERKQQVEIERLRAENAKLLTCLRNAQRAAVNREIHTGQVCDLDCGPYHECYQQVSNMMVCARARQALEGDE